MTTRFHRLAGRFLLAVGATTLVLGSLPAGAADPAAVELGTAGSFGVLGGQSVTNTGPTIIAGDVGVSPGTSITGFPPGTHTGTLHSADANAALAQTETTTAYNDAAGRPTDASLPADLVGLTLVPGVYTAVSTLGLSGTVTLDARGDPDAVWIFQVGSALTTASGSSVMLIDGAQACNVFWQIGSSATLGTDSDMVGTVLALTSITANTGATVDGRLLARNGSVTLDTNVITQSECAPPVTTTTTTTTTAPTTTTTTTAAPTTTTTAAPTTTTTAPATTPTTAGPVFPVAGTPPTGPSAGGGPVGATGTAGPVVPVAAAPPSGPAGGGPTTPAGGSGDGGSATRTPQGGDGGSATPITRLPQTGSERTVTLAVGVLTILLGIGMSAADRRARHASLS